MLTTDSLFQTALQRQKEQHLSYYGILTVEETYQLLHMHPATQLIDVRTKAERDWVGNVNIPAPQHHSIEWMLYPKNTPNPDFITQLKALIPDQSTPLVFLCRSGVRSDKAANLATQQGYAFCFNILHGFEGDKDQYGHRKTINGWCHANLPWVGT